MPTTLLQLDASHACAVIELGTNHFGEIAYLSKICEPTMAIITNIGPSHLESFKDLDGVLKEKQAVLDSLKEPRIAVLNADDPLLKKIVARHRAPLGRRDRKALFSVGFGIQNPCDFQARDIRRDAAGFSFMMHQGKKLRLTSLGRSNIYNALCAVAAGRMLGVNYPAIVSRLKSFVFPDGRLTLRSIRDTRFIDDTYNANPLSMRQAMDALCHAGAAGRRVLVMGDMLELGTGTGGFHRDAGRIAAASCDIFITVGKHTLAAAEAAVSSGFNKDNLFTCETAAQAKDILFHTVSVRKNDVVLLKGSRGMKLEQILEPA